MKIKAVLFMKELNIKMKRIIELLPISKSTIYRKQGLAHHSSESSNFNNLLKERIDQIRKGLIESISVLKLTKPIYPNVVWVTDFIHDALINNKSLRILIIQDAHTKKIVGYRIDRSITAEDTLETFKEAIRENGKPHVLRS